ncbi:GEVED domain-containing protein [Vibrio chagasii]|nr:GEVED domain-containing protein [Vibrio chagasii]
MDVDGNDDDGITLTNLEIGLDSLINVNVVGNGYLQAWADWDLSGTFDDDEQILKNHSVVEGGQVVPIRVADDASVGTVQARFRLAVP